MMPRPCGFARPRDLAPRHLLEVDHLLRRCRVAAAELGRPTGHQPAGVEQRALPLARPLGQVRARLLRFARTRSPRRRFASSHATSSARNASSSGAYCRRIAAQGSFLTFVSRNSCVGSPRGLRVLCRPGDAARFRAPFPRRQGTDRSYVRDAYDDDGTELGRDDVWAGLRDIGALGLLVPEEHGGAGGWAWSTPRSCSRSSAARCARRRTRRRRSARSRSCSARARRGSTRSCSPGLADGSTVGTVALLRGRRAVRMARARRPAPSATAKVASRREPRCTSPTAPAADLLLVTRRDRPTARSACSRCRATTTRCRPSSRRQSVDGSRKEATRRFDGAPGWRLGAGDAPGAVARTLDRMAVAYVVDGVGAAQRALSSRSSTRRSGCSSTSRSARSRPCSTSAPTCCAPLELGRAAGYYACWAADDAEPDEAHRAAVMAKAFASERVRAARRQRDPGVRRHRLHVGARHPPVLQAAALARVHARVERRRAEALADVVLARLA